MLAKDIVKFVNIVAGLRIDHQLLSPSVAPRLSAAGVDCEVRGWEKASDHAPVWIYRRDPKSLAFVVGAFGVFFVGWGILVLGPQWLSGKARVRKSARIANWTVT